MRRNLLLISFGIATGSLFSQIIQLHQQIQRIEGAHKILDESGILAGQVPADVEECALRWDDVQNKWTLCSNGEALGTNLSVSPIAGGDTVPIVALADGGYRIMSLGGLWGPDCHPQHRDEPLMAFQDSDDYGTVATIACDNCIEVSQMTKK